MALSTARDPDVELRMFKTRNKRVRGFALVLYADNDVVARRVVSQTLRTLDQRGVRVDGRWVGITATALTDELLAMARFLGCRLLTPGQRLQQAISDVETLATRAAGLSGARR